MEESQNIEWKESWKDEYIKWICGFANAQGGTIYIGKDDNGVIIGIDNSKKLMEDIPNKVRDILGILVDVNLYYEEEKEYIGINVLANPYPVSYKGEYHYRTGSTKQQLKGQALNQFLLRKTGITWDSVPVGGVTVQDFRNDSFDIFREHALKSKRIDEKDLLATNEQLLDSLNLLEDGIIKKAAILLFHHNPEKWIPGSYIKVGYFETDSELKYQDEIHGSLISQADKVVDLIFTKYLKAQISYDGVIRVETYPFPKEAIREAVFNAITHKFYGTLVPIQISIYSDRMYIANDCIFPEEWTVNDLMEKHKSRPYNPLIANTFFRAGFVEAWGRGIEKIKDSCIEIGNPLPEYKLKREDIMVMFKSNLAIDNQGANQGTNQGTNQAIVEVLEYKELSVIEKQIIDMILQFPTLSQKKIAIMLDEKYSKVKFYMEELKKKKIIYREGSSQKGKWIVSIHEKNDII